MIVEARAVVKEYNFYGRVHHEVVGYNVSENGGPFVFMTKEQVNDRFNELELLALQDRRERIKSNLAEARRLRADVDRVIEGLESGL